LDWKKLLSKKQIGDAGIVPSADGRTQYQRDFDRIVFCSAFRRLQDKTQVFPLPESDFVHTRLTHSLEVSCVGRSLGSIAGKTIIERHPELKDEFTSFNFGEIVAAACLAHDIGNPPFGHSGEDAISEYFRMGSGTRFQSDLKSRKCWNDFAKFEGNAQGFRIITKLQNPNIKGGLKLTCASLAAFTKYSKDSSDFEDHSVIANKKLSRKFGFFQSEKDLFTEVAEETGLKKIKDNWWARHPLAFLVEAADDICYRVMDLEDGFRLGLLTFNDTKELLKPLCTNAKFTAFDNRDENDKIGYLRAKAISVLIDELVSAFLDEEENILNGKFEEDLISCISKAGQLAYIKNLSIEKIYSYKSVVEREAAGYEVLGGLLDTYINAVNEMESGAPSLKSKTMLKLLPKQFLGKDGKPDDSLYTRLLKITDFVSGMTDSYAVSLYRKIKGISLPGR
jgi:dGTPase